MNTFNTKETISEALLAFNKRAYNAGLDFKMIDFCSDCLWIQASFDFMRYVNVDIEFRQVHYTNIDKNQYWTDAWHDDQLMLLSQDELENVIDFKDLDINTDKPYFGIVFNINGFENFYNTGLVICEELYIQWRN